MDWTRSSSYLDFILYSGMVSQILVLLVTYKPTLLETKQGLILFRRYNPTSSHTSALSKLPIVTMNNGFPSFSTQAPLSSNNKDFLAWFMVLIIFPSISIKELTELVDLSSSSIEIEGSKWAIPNLMNLYSALFLIALNHSITVEVFLHWLYRRLQFNFEIIFSRYFLLTIPISLLEGLIRRHFWLVLKFSLWSFKVMNTGLLA